MSTAEIVARLWAMHDCDGRGCTVEDAIAALEQQDELLHLRRKMLNYIAFVLTDDEQADPQLAADRAKTRLEQQEAEIARLRGAMDADDERLLQAAQKAGRTPMGCDTADDLAETVLGLRAERDALRAQVEARDAEIARLTREATETWARRLAEDSVLAGEVETTGMTALEEVCRERDALLATVERLTAALRELRINANRLCDRNLGGTYEDDCRRSIAVADAALAAEAPKEQL